MKTVGIGIIGGGLMGREMASTFGRWFAINDMPARPELVAVADLSDEALGWFANLPHPPHCTRDYAELLAMPDVDVVYVAVPHNLHQKIYLDVLDAGKDLLAEKPFGIDLSAAATICQRIESSGRFVRCSSEFPFFPAVQRIVSLFQNGKMGRILDVRSAFHHSSDLDPKKAANWKRLSATCGEIGVMGDLGMHTCHVPFRLGLKPDSVFAQLQKGYAERPDGKGGSTACDTWDNAMLHTWTEKDGGNVPVQFEMRRLAPGATNTWILEVHGTDGGARFSTADPKALWTFNRARGPGWTRTELGFGTAFPTVTGGIFEVGFPDVIQQMWAAYIAEREGILAERFGCVTPEEALYSHQLFDAALRSAAGNTVELVAG
ncbi:MAG: Gfo/Idh/MocA family oxidoreductase [Verrucomicrobiota bacterium]